MGSRPKKIKVSAVGVDHLSALPNHLLTNILSLLPTAEAVCTNALSKRWRGVCKAVPAVHIRKKLPLLVTNWLLNRDPDVQILSFCVAEFPTRPSDTMIDQWISTALSYNVENLHLSLDLDPAQHYYPTLCPNVASPDHYQTVADTFLSCQTLYKVPRHLFAKSTLRHLLLRDCELLLPEEMHSFSLGLLETLSLQRIRAPQDRLQCLISACPRLTELTLEECLTVRTIMVQPASNLFRAFTMRCCHNAEKVVVDAPLLLFLEYKGRLLYGHNPLSLTNWEQLEELSIEICEDFPVVISNHLPGLHMIADILKKTINLKVLTVGKISPKDDNTPGTKLPKDLQIMTDIECLKHTLTMINVVGYDEQPGLQRMLRFLLHKAITVEEIHVSFAETVKKGSATEDMLLTQITQMNSGPHNKKIVFMHG